MNGLKKIIVRFYWRTTLQFGLMDQVYEFTWKGVTILAKMDEQAELKTSLPRRSRFVVIVVLCFCFVSFMFLYTTSTKPTVR